MTGPLSQQLLLRPEDLSPSGEALEVIGAFNPGAIEYGDETVLLVRVAERTQHRRAGYTALARWESGQIVTDWVADYEVELLDPRVVRRTDGLLRLTSTSHVRAVFLRDGKSVAWREGGRLIPQESWEEYGIEDPRVVWLEDRYWITYVAVSRHGAATALASTEDFASFERHGIIFCPENKDVVLFPERLGDRFAALHRPTTAHPFCRPEMWLARSADLIHWGAHQPLHGGRAAWESDRVGGGAPPLRTAAGWLEIYHASRRSETAGQVGAYAAGALLLDLDDPARVLAQSQRPLWEPEAAFERSGFVPRVVFPTGVVLRADRLQLFYGAADTCTAMAELSLGELLGQLEGV